MRSLKVKLKTEKGIHVNSGAFATGRVNTKHGVDYWVFKGMYVMYKADYKQEIVNEAFMERARTVHKGLGVKHSVNYTEEQIDMVNEIVRLRKEYNMAYQDIADKVGCSKASVSHVLNGRSCSDLTGIQYKRKYNRYDENGALLETKEVQASGKVKRRSD